MQYRILPLSSLKHSAHLWSLRLRFLLLLAHLVELREDATHVWVEPGAPCEGAMGQGVFRGHALVPQVAVLSDAPARRRQTLARPCASNIAWVWKVLFEPLHVFFLCFGIMGTMCVCV